MGDVTPDEIVEGFSAALRIGDAGAVTALFSREGCVVTPDSTVIHGRSRIRNFFQQLVDLPGEPEIDQRTMLTAGDVAVGRGCWTTPLGRGSSAVRRSSRSTIILARVEGAWKIAVADLWWA